MDLGQRNRGMDRLRPPETRTLPGGGYIRDAGRSEPPVKVEERWGELQEYPVRNHSETKVFSLKLHSCYVWRTWRYLHVGQRKGRNCVEVPNEFSVVSKVYAGTSQAHGRCVDSSNAEDTRGKSTTGLMACMLLAGWFAALRGEEIVRIDMGQMRQHWVESTEHEGAPHIPLMLSGRFKREIGEKVFCQPLAMDQDQG